MKKTLLAASLLWPVLLGAGQARADLINATIHGQYYFPDTLNLYQDLGNKVVSPTAVFDFTSAGGITFTISGNQIVTSNYVGGAVAGAFNGPLFTVVSGGTPITGVTIDPATNVPGFNASRVSFTSTSVSENVQGLIFPGNPNITLDLTFASTAVPEPSPLILGGVAGSIVCALTLLSRRRSKSVGRPA